MGQDLKELSKQEWTTEAISFDAINCGSLKRIASAVETVSKNYNDLIRDRDWYKKAYEQSQEEVAYQLKSKAALKGQITKLKRRISK